MEERENVVAAKSAKRTHSSGMRYLGKNKEFMYSLQDRIGQGQFGTVYKGVQTSTNKTVAVKLFRITEPVNLQNDDAEERYKKEEEELHSEERQNEKHLRLMRVQQKVQNHKRREKTNNDKQMQRLPHEVSTLWKLRDFGCPNILHIYSAWYKQKVVEKQIPVLSSTSTTTTNYSSSSCVQSKEREQEEEHHVQSPVCRASPIPSTTNNGINTCSPGEMKMNKRETCTYQTELHYIIVTEYCAGSDLQHRLLEHGKVDEVTARALIYQLANALHFLKRQRIIHRDIKPANILLTSRNMAKAVLKIADFGMAKVAPAITNPPLPISSSSSQSLLTNLENTKEEEIIEHPERREEKCKVSNANTNNYYSNNINDKIICNVCNKSIEENNNNNVENNNVNDDVSTYDDDDDDDEDDDDEEDDKKEEHDNNNNRNRQKNNRLPSKICNMCNKVPFYSTLFQSELGTPLYMSPERIHGQPYGFKADVYSAGMILYELMTGHPVKVRNMHELKHKVPRAMDALVREYDVRSATRDSLPTNYVYEEQSKCAIPMWLDLLRKMTAGNPLNRLSIEDVLRHSWFHSETGLPVLPELTCALPPVVLATTSTAATTENINVASDNDCQANSNGSISNNDDNNSANNVINENSSSTNTNIINKCNELETQNEKSKMKENDDQCDTINNNNQTTNNDNSYSEKVKEQATHDNEESVTIQRVIENKLIELHANPKVLNSIDESNHVSERKANENYTSVNSSNCNKNDDIAHNDESKVESCIDDIVGQTTVTQCQENLSESTNLNIVNYKWQCSEEEEKKQDEDLTATKTSILHYPTKVEQEQKEEAEREEELQLVNNSSYSPFWQFINMSASPTCITNNNIANSNVYCTNNKVIVESKDLQITLNELSESLSRTCNSYIVTEATRTYIHCIYHEMIKNETDMSKQLVLVHYLCQLFYNGYTLFVECQRQEEILQTNFQQKLDYNSYNDKTNSNSIHSMEDCKHQAENKKNSFEANNKNKCVNIVEVNSTEAINDLPLNNIKIETNLPNVDDADETTTTYCESQIKVHQEYESSLELTLVAIWRQLFREITKMWTSLQQCYNNKYEQENSARVKESQIKVNSSTKNDKNDSAEQLVMLWPHPKLTMVSNIDTNLEIDGAEQLILHKALTLIEHAVLTAVSLDSTIVVAQRSTINMSNVETTTTSHHDKEATMTQELTENNLNKKEIQSANDSNNNNNKNTSPKLIDDEIGERKNDNYDKDCNIVDVNKEYTNVIFTFKRALALLRVLAEHLVISWSDINNNFNNKNNTTAKLHDNENLFVKTREFLGSTCHTRQRENKEFDYSVNDNQSATGKEVLLNLQTCKLGEKLISYTSERELMCLLHVPLMHSLSERDKSVIEHLINDVTHHVMERASRTEKKKVEEIYKRFLK